MSTESIEDFLARGGEVDKSNKNISLEQLLYNEGILDHQEVEGVKKAINSGLTKGLNDEVNKRTFTKNPL